MKKPYLSILNAMGLTTLAEAAGAVEGDKANITPEALTEMQGAAEKMRADLDAAAANLSTATTAKTAAEEALTAANAAKTTAETALAAANTKIEALEAKVKELGGLPGDTHEKPKGGEGDEVVATNLPAYADASMPFYNMLP